MAEVAVMLFDVALGVAGIGMMIPGLLPGKGDDKSHSTVVRIGAGMHGLASDEEKTSASGDFPDVMLYDEAGQYIGRNKGKMQTIEAGGFKDVTITHNKGRDGLAATYLGVAASGKDAICINFITVTQANGGQYGWLGDVGQACGAAWYYSDTPVLNTDTNSQEAQTQNNRTSSCTWIDKDKADSKGPVPIPHQGFGMHITDFSSSKDIDEDGRAKQYNDNPKTRCSSAPRFKMYEMMSTDTWIPIFYPKLQYNSDNTDADLAAVIDKPGIDISTNQRRALERNARNSGEAPQKTKQAIPYARQERNNTSNPPSAPFMAGALVKSVLEQHSAEQLCKSDTSRGPDFVSHTESLFCDMDKKQVWPLCTDAVAQACFDTELNQMRPGTKGRRWINGREIPQKSYHKEITWGSKV